MKGDKTRFSDQANKSKQAAPPPPQTSTSSPLATLDTVLAPADNAPPAGNDSLRSRMELRPQPSRSHEPSFVSQAAVLPTHTKTVFLGDIAKHEGQTITEFFAVAQKQLSRKRDGAAYLSLRLTDRTGQCEARDVG